MDPTEGKEPDLREATIVSIDESKNIVKKERERERKGLDVSHTCGGTIVVEKFTRHQVVGKNGLKVVCVTRSLLYDEFSRIAKGSCK